MRITLRSLAATGVLIATAAATGGAQQINTGSTGSIFASPFGSPDAATYGQTFTAVPGSTNLDQFAFQFAYNSGADASLLTFQAYLMQWDGAEAEGPVLYQSAVQHGTNSTSPVTYTFDTGGTPINAGTVYVAFVNASDYIADGGDAETLGIIGGASNFNGNFVYDANGANFASLTTQVWSCGDLCGYGSVAFTASFDDNVVGAPEPATLPLLATGLIGIVGFAKRRNRRLAEFSEAL